MTARISAYMRSAAGSLSDRGIRSAHTGATQHVGAIATRYKLSSLGLLLIVC